MYDYGFYKNNAESTFCVVACFFELKIAFYQTLS